MSQPFPRHGGCLCGDIRYSLAEDPLTLYVCHCSDCQTQTGTSFSLSMVVRREAFELVRGRPEEYSVELSDGRIKSSRYCGRCCSRIFGRSRAPELAVLDAGTLDDTSWLHPVGHIWTASAQPWVRLPDDTLNFEQQPGEKGHLALVRAWKQRDSR